MFNIIKNNKIKCALGVILTLGSPFILMGIVYFIDFFGGQLVGNVFHIVPVDKNIPASIYEYLYLYSQYLNVLVMGVLTLGLCIFAFKDFIYKHLTEVKIKLYVGERIKIAVNQNRTYFHIPLIFKNDSPKSGVIENIEMIFDVNSITYNYVTENEIIESTKFMEGGKVKYDTFDGEPFSCTPIEGEGVIRKIVTFNTAQDNNIEYRANEKYYLIFKFGTDEQRLELSFNQSEIDYINRAKIEEINPMSAKNFWKNIKSVKCV